MVRSLLILGILSCSTSHGLDVIDNAVNDAVNGLLDMYVEDCKDNEEVHGYYGALFQPCNFQFFESTGRRAEEEEEDTFYNSIDTSSTSNACWDENSVQLLETAPVDWIFNFSQRIADVDFDELKEGSGDIFKDLLLWPDQCVGVSPRCYDLKNNDKILEMVELIFEENGFPKSATHVSVDCRSDAVELSRLVYSATSGLGKSSTTIALWLITVLALTLVLSCYCCLCCFRLCCCCCRSDEDKYGRRMLRPKTSKYSQIAMAEVLDDEETMTSNYSDESPGDRPKKPSL